MKIVSVISKFKENSIYIEPKSETGFMDKLKMIFVGD